MSTNVANGATSAPLDTEMWSDRQDGARATGYFEGGVDVELDVELDEEDTEEARAPPSRSFKLQAPYKPIAPDVIRALANLDVPHLAANPPTELREVLLRFIDVLQFGRPGPAGHGKGHGHAGGVDHGDDEEEEEDEQEDGTLQAMQLGVQYLIQSEALLAERRKRLEDMTVTSITNLRALNEQFVELKHRRALVRKEQAEADAAIAQCKKTLSEQASPEVTRLAARRHALESSGEPPRTRPVDADLDLPVLPRVVYEHEYEQEHDGTLTIGVFPPPPRGPPPATAAYRPPPVRDYNEKFDYDYRAPRRSSVGVGRSYSESSDGAGSLPPPIPLGVSRSPATATTISSPGQPRILAPLNMAVIGGTAGPSRRHQLHELHPDTPAGASAAVKALSKGDEAAFDPVSPVSGASHSSEPSEGDDTVSSGGDVVSAAPLVPPPGSQSPPPMRAHHAARQPSAASERCKLGSARGVAPGSPPVSPQLVAAAAAASAAEDVDRLVSGGGRGVWGRRGGLVVEEEEEQEEDFDDDDDEENVLLGTIGGDGVY